MNLLQALPPTMWAVLGVISLFFIWEIAKHHNNKKRSKLPPPPPAIPGLPVLGNMLQLKEMKPFKTFAKWAEEYGPIYSIRTGANRMVVLNSATVAKEALVTRHSSISAKKLSNAVTILTAGKIIAMSDYNEFYKNAKRNLLNSILGANVQKRYRFLRDDMIDGIYEQLLAHSRDAHTSEKAVDFRAIFQTELFRLAMKQDLGEAVESLYVEEFGKTLSIDEIYKILVVDPVKGSAAVDWREFFPYLKWIPNRAFTERLQQLVYKRRIVMEEIIRQQKQHLAAGSEQVTKSYLQHLLFEADFALSDEELMILVWESLAEADTTAVAAEWAMYELSKHPQIQNNLVMEIRKVCGSEKLTEENLCQMPYLSAVFHETLRLHSPAPLIPLRYAEEDTELGGYFIQKGTQIAVNIYGCNMDNKVWDSPEEWRPERFLTGKDNAMELYKTMAFGAGKRACAGSQQAMLISCVTIGRAVQEFEWRLVEGEEGDVDTEAFLTRKLHPLRAMIKPRK